MKVKLNKSVEKIFKRKEDITNTEQPKEIEISNKNMVMYILIAFMLALTVISLSLAFKTYKNTNKENYAQYSSEKSTQTAAQLEEIKKAEEEEKQRLEEERIRNEQIEKEKKIEEEKRLEEEKLKQQKLEEERIRKEKIAKEKAQKLNFTAPLIGEIMKDYSINNVVYYQTLDVWKIHEGVDIKAEEGASIASVEAGKVIAVKSDPLYGKIIVIDHGQGYKSIYCNLQEDVLVKEGEAVKKDKIIAKVGTTAVCEKKEGPHLHFEITKDSKYVNPKNIIKF